MQNVALCLGIGLALSSTVAGQDLVAVTWSGNALSIDPATAAVTTLGSTGFQYHNAMAKSSNGTLYASVTDISTEPVVDDDIVRINPSTGVGTFVVETDIGGIRCMAFGPGDVLYAVTNPTLMTPTNDLYRINLTTGKATLIGNTGHRMQGLAYGKGKLYGWEIGTTGTGEGLVTVDTLTAAVTDVNPAVSGTIAVQTLAFDSCNKLYACGSGLWEVNTGTGVQTQIGSATGQDIRGIESTLTVSVASAEIVRLGVPPNPLAFLPGVTSGPVTGFTWDPVVNHATFVPGATLDFMGVSATPLNLPSGIGTVLCAPPAPFLTFTSAPGVPFAVAIPADCSLAGAGLCSQAGSVDPLSGFRLANALDIIVGTF